MTTTSIHIDFDKLEKNIAELKKLLPELEEPSYGKTEFWTNGASGSGIVLDCLEGFCNRTIDFHKHTYALIENTIKYLESVKKLKTADQHIADSL